MNEFCLSNCISINLNYLIFISELYEYSKNDNQININFTEELIDKKYFLDKNVFYSKTKKLWEIIYTDPELYSKDIRYWNMDKFQFQNLFRLSKSDINIYEKLKSKFECWFFETCHKMCDDFSSELVLNYYNKLINYSETNNLPLKNINFYLQVVYKLPSKDWIQKNENSIIICPNSELPDDQVLFNILRYQ